MASAWIGMADDVAAEQAVHGRMQLDPARLPGQLDVLIADVLDQVRIDERVLNRHPGDAADARVVDVIAAHDGAADDRRRLHVPILGTDVERHAVGLTQRQSSMIQ